MLRGQDKRGTNMKDMGRGVGGGRGDGGLGNQTIVKNNHSTANKKIKLGHNNPEKYKGFKLNTN